MQCNLNMCEMESCVIFILHVAQTDYVNENKDYSTVFKTVCNIPVPVVISQN